ncbi:MAG: tyrosine recombinase XerC [Clostridia bacterium]|nr:tyrosine recombinase XerC [Clostridia bacterium]
MQTIKGKSPNTVKEYSLDLKIFFKFMKYHFGLVDCSIDQIDDIPINELDYSFVNQIKLTDLFEYLSFMSDVRKNKPSTRARKVACLRSYFKYMNSKAHYIDDNPAKDLDSPKTKQSMPRYLELDECKALLETVRKSNSERDYAIIFLFLNCGMRVSELVGINISDVREDTLVVTGKGNKERIIYLNNACINAIKAYMKVRPVDGVKDRNALFLSKQNKRISVKTVQWLVKKYIKEANLDESKFSVHKLRHTAATIMYKYGETDLRTLQEILGHEQLATTQIYTHIDDKERRKAADNNPLGKI